MKAPLRASVLTTLFLAGASACAATPDEKFASLGKRYLDEFTRLSPVSATLLGDHRYDGELNQVSPETRAASVAFSREYLEELRAIPRAELSRAHQIDAALLEHDLESTIWRLERLREWEWNPLRYTSLAGNAVYGLVARAFAPLEERLANVAVRLEKFPRLFEQIRATLIPERVPKIHAETAVKQNRGVLSILSNMVEPELGAVSEALRARLTTAIATARDAVEKHQKWLEDEVVPKAAGEFRIGAELYDEKLAFTLNSPLSRKEIRERAESELARVRAEMYEISKIAYKKAHPYTEFPERPSAEYRQALIRSALEMAYAEKPDRNRIVETAKESLALIEEFVRERDLITLLPDPIEIIVMPEFRRGVSLAYCDSPGPLDVGQKTFYAVAPLPKDWTETQVQSFLREYNLRSLHDLTIHEAIPGHYLQLARSNRYPSVLRAVLSSGPFIEGWAVYTEQMMADEGFLGGDPLMKLIARKWYLRGIANALIDQAIHTGGMTRDEAMKVMVEDTFQEEREAAAKWVRAQLTSTQLATYFVGYLEHVDLRREVEAAWGEEFALKKYHDTVISFGSPPVKYVRALMLDLEIPR